MRALISVDWPRFQSLYILSLTEDICDGDTQVRFVHVLSQGCIDRRLYMWRSSAL
jgi:hypothetical protein